MRLRCRNVAVIVTTGLVAACSVLPQSDPADSGSIDDLPDLRGETVSVTGVWSGAEQDAFEKVMGKFEDVTGAKVVYNSAGDEIATVLSSKIDGDAAPDIAFLPQPGLMKNFAVNDHIQPLSDETVSAVDRNYAEIWRELGSYKSQAYGIWFDVSNKSMVWYNAPMFKDAGVEVPTTWDDLLDGAKKLNDDGVKAPISVGGADGWTLTDWFENAYIRVAGVDSYDQLSTHEIAWTDESVLRTLALLAELFDDDDLIGSPTAALDTDFPTSVTNVFADKAGSALVYEGSFVAGVIADSTEFTVGDGAKSFPFPAINDSPDSVVGGGDVGVQFNDDEATEAFMTYLASPEAASLMVSTGSFTTANTAMDLATYPNEHSRAIGQAIVDAGNNFRFDMSDMAPAEFGATVGAGEQKVLQDFLRDPSDPEKTATKLEKLARQAYD